LVVPFDAYVWVLTDPETTVGASPLAEVPSLSDLPSVIRLKYLTPINRWTRLPPDKVMTLADVTSGDLLRSALWRELLHSYGVHDIVSAVLHDTMGCWGFLDLWRTSAQQPAFTPDEQALKCMVAPDLFAALDNAWGRQGWTTLTLAGATQADLAAGLAMAHAHAITKPTRKR